jgi:hypothetical protein
MAWFAEGDTDADEVEDNDEIGDIWLAERMVLLGVGTLRMSMF